MQIPSITLPFCWQACRSSPAWLHHRHWRTNPTQQTTVHHSGEGCALYPVGGEREEKARNKAKGRSRYAPPHLASIARECSFGKAYITVPQLGNSKLWMQLTSGLHVSISVVSSFGSSVILVLTRTLELEAIFVHVRTDISNYTEISTNFFTFLLILSEPASYPVRWAVGMICTFCWAPKRAVMVLLWQKCYNLETVINNVMFLLASYQGHIEYVWVLWDTYVLP